MPIAEHSIEDWEKRQAALREILATEDVGDQAHLIRLLKRRGFKVTQSSVSRDLADLKAVKLDGRYVLRDALIGPAEASRAESNAALALAREVRRSGANLLVVKTTAGGAQAVGLAIDQAAWPEVVGTVAGDDTVFVAVLGRREQAKVEARLEGMRA